MGIFLKRFDQIVLGCIFTLVLLIAIVWGIGDRTMPKVTTFSWEGKQISVADRAFALTLNEAIDPAFVQQNLNIDPPLPGTISWIGKRFFYTLKDLPIYGQEYQIKLADPDTTATKAVKPQMMPFLSRFKTRDRAFAYIGTEGEDRGRLVLYNLTQQEKSILTPADLIVLNFEVYPNGDRLLFSAIPKGGVNIQIGDQKLYTVVTGLNQAAKDHANTGQIREILNATDYLNGNFQLAQNGQRIIVQRTNREDPRDRSLWVIEGQAEPRALGIPADEFLLSPKADIIAVTQQNQLSIVPLSRNSGAIQAKPAFSKLLAFSPDQTEQIVLQEKAGDRALYILNDQGKERRLLDTPAPIIECRYEPRRAELLYCLKIDQQVNNGQAIAEPFLSVINLATGEETPLLALPNYQDVRLSIAADGLALLFDQVVTANPNPQSNLFTETGLAVEGGRLWLLALPELEENPKDIQPVPPESLMPGYKPQWMP